MLHYYAINANVSKGSQLVTQVEDSWWRLFWGKEFFRVRFESHDAAN
jgi:hypothetical protein